MTSSLARRDVDGLLARVCTVPTLKWSVIGDERLFEKDIRKILRAYRDFSQEMVSNASL